MCGIVGIISHGSPGIDAALSRAVRALAHRGPDDAGTYIGAFGRGAIALGHRRLSILELSEAGHQPMVHPQTGDVLIYNGEIYNYQEIRRDLEKGGSVFIGHSDTEVLLHALTHWGSSCISLLEGMYAFVFLDRRRQRLILARDPVGIKPLYWAVGPDCLVFASEVKGILATGYIEPALDGSGIAGMLAYGAVQQPQTIFKQIRGFPAGSMIDMAAAEFVAGSWPKSARYWVFPRLSSSLNFGDACARTRGLLERAVRSHLMSDVPVGIFLSSGTDSSIIATLAARLSTNVPAFTIGFEDARASSEIQMAARTAGALKLTHTSIWIDPKQGQNLAGDWIRALDQPSIDGLNTYVISRLISEAGIKVALSGQGGDELFGGYPSFFDVPRIRSAMRFVRLLPRSMRAVGARILGAGRGIAFRDKLHDIASTNGALADIYLQRRRLLSNRQMQLLGISDESGENWFLAPECTDELNLDDSDECYSVSLLETRMYLGNTLLHVGDFTSMASGLEIRVPFLDKALMEFIFSLPGRIRIGPERKAKYLLRSAFADCLRPELLAKEKQGFVFPINKWLAGSWREFAESSLDDLVRTGCVEEHGVRKIWAEFVREPATSLWSRSWALVVLGAYIKDLAID